MSKRKLDDSFVRWKELLGRATATGLRSTSIQVVQVPDANNGHVAVIHARVEFEDGRSFEDVGDAFPDNCSATTSLALLRMASTRAKARCFRDALNIGEVADVELPHYQPSGNSIGENTNHGPQAPQPRATVQLTQSQLVCSNANCHRPITQSQHAYSAHHFGQALCPSCQKLVSGVGR